MLIDIKETLNISGISGRIYRFDIYAFDSFEDLNTSFKPGIPALYLFTRMIIYQNEHLHNFLYIGETRDLSTRFKNHHKHDEIIRNNANCIGIHTFFGTDKERINAETDILNNYDFPCNEQNNK